MSDGILDAVLSIVEAFMAANDNDMVEFVLSARFRPNWRVQQLLCVEFGYLDDW